MKTLAEIRVDLKDVRYYYNRKKIFDEASNCVGKSAVVDKVLKYNDAIRTAPPIIYDLYVSLYIKNYTQESLSEELCYTPEYVQMLNKKLLVFFQKCLSD